MNERKVVPYSEFKKRREAQEKAKKSLITLVTVLYSEHKEDPKDVA